MDRKKVVLRLSGTNGDAVSLDFHFEQSSTQIRAGELQDEIYMGSV